MMMTISVDCQVAALLTAVVAQIPDEQLQQTVPAEGASVLWQVWDMLWILLQNCLFTPELQWQIQG
jgi:hypothetical protein